MYCPRFIYDMAVARSAAEFLGAELALETYAKKYAEGLTELYSEIAVISITEPAESMLQFLSEIEAGELAVELLNDYVYFRLFFEGVGKPRKMKPMFGSLEDPAKTPETSSVEAAKGFVPLFSRCGPIQLRRRRRGGSWKTMSICLNSMNS